MADGPTYAVHNTIVYAEEWAQKLQDRLSEPVKWKEIMRVEYTDSKVFHNPYLTDPTVQTGTRGTAYTPQEIVETDESVNITTYKVLPQFIDRADLAQSTFMRQMEMADRQAVLLNESIESAVYADHASRTDFDNASIGGSAGNITVSATNIDNIITGIKREIREAGGENLMERNGVFIVWRPADLEILEQFCAANGFGFADETLANGIGQGKRALGVTHYSSNLLTSGHVMAGVRKVYHWGILRATYGQVMVNEKDPMNISGISVVSRVDFGIKAWNKTAGVLFDVLVG